MAVARRAARALTPTGLHGLGRRGYLRFGTATASRRMPPGMIMVGASRCGTTSLFRALSAHPRVVRPAANKGVRYFDLNYWRGHRWYLGHFPLTLPAAARTRGGPPLTFEATGYYLFHPVAVQRIAADLPGVRLVAMIRDPVERAWSAWKHETARGFETVPFERALELEDERLHGERERLAQDPAYRSLAHQHQSHRSRGEYVDQLERVLRHVPRERVHVVQSEAFFAEPGHEYRRLLDFLELPGHDPDGFAVHNARPSAPMPGSVRARLLEHYAPYDARLEDLLGEPLRWR
ncbi:MAG: sulfotransferase [Angustibacter sp.]